MYIASRKLDGKLQVLQFFLGKTCQGIKSTGRVVETVMLELVFLFWEDGLTESLI